MIRTVLYVSNRTAGQSRRFFGNQITKSINDAADSELGQQITKVEPGLYEQSERITLWKLPTPVPQPYSSNKVGLVLAKTPEEADKIVESILETQNKSNSYY